MKMKRYTLALSLWYEKFKRDCTAKKLTIAPLPKITCTCKEVWME